MKFDFQGEIVVVTGGARGIGKNIAIRFALAGAKVVIIDNNEELAVKLVQECLSENLDVDYLATDLSQIHQAEELVDGLIQKYQRINVLINNARAGERTGPLSETVENWELAFNVSLKAPLLISQTLISRTPTTSRQSSILNISSVASKGVCQESASYHLVKAALENMTRYLAVHGGPKGFRVNAICPGFIVQDEHIARYRQKDNYLYRAVSAFCHPLGRVGSSDDVANAALFLCSDFAGFITGQVLTVDGGLTIQDQWDLICRFRQANITEKNGLKSEK